MNQYSQLLRVALVVAALLAAAPTAWAWADGGGGRRGESDGGRVGRDGSASSVSVSGGGSQAPSAGVSNGAVGQGSNASVSSGAMGGGGANAANSPAAGASGGGWGGGSGGSAGNSGAGGSGSSPFSAFWNSVHEGSGGTVGPARAEAERQSEMKSEQRLAREAVSRGLIQPLDAILPKVEEKVPGSLLSVRLRRDESGAWIYGLVILSPDGKYRKVLIDAAENRILQAK